ncbi:antibiotic biosynthesis monooxygenase [Rhodoligotrophos ferricapiens]|uniref:antibiotic biosynthesis monooxygenase n=1 Tax=Rhodoligotrophos ferricapiens TaxID=3069264 RepID=UPI00315C7C10
MTETSRASPAETVTVVVHRRIREGRESAFQAAMQEFTGFALSFPGHRGMQLFRMIEGGRDYTVVARFESKEARRAFTSTPEYAAWMRRLRELTEGDPRIDELSGLEGWFARDDVPGLPKPGKVKMAVATFIGVFPVSTIVGLLVVPYIQHFPMLLVNAIVAAIIVILLTWVVMPIVTRALHRWLFPEAHVTASPGRTHSGGP